MVHRFAAALLVVPLVLTALFATSALRADDTVAARHWAFRPLVRPSLPTSTRDGHARLPIDRFIDAALDAQRIAPVDSADAATLLRRLSLDLIGLPPTLDDLETLLADSAPDALDRHVDRLLASPRYGERWARPWLDLCHYADTDGYLTDQARPVAWRYRQWLLDALNRDLPYDEFTVQQLAGDLVPYASLDQRLATGFLRNTLSNREGGADLEEFRVEQVVDRVQMVGTIWLGMTVGCARCHDHKFDPLSQEEFYRLYALLDGGDEVNVDAPLPGEAEPYLARRGEYERRRAELIAPVAEGLALLQARWESRLLEAASQPGRDHVWDRQWEVLGLIWGGHLGEGQLEGTQIVRIEPHLRRPDERDRLTDYFLRHGAVIDSQRFGELKLGELSGKLDKLAAEYPKLTRAPAMRESPVRRAVHVHDRGDFRTPGALVTGGVPSELPPLSPDAPLNRLGLARWLVRADHPLTARVAANRAWQEFFGRGLVTTADDFGAQGEPPSHPELLDWLATRLVERGWSMKILHRDLVGTATYRRSSSAPRAVLEVDPANRWLARQSPLRLSADQIRDALLASADLLDHRVGGPSVFPPQPASVTAEAFDNTWKPSRGGDAYRRALYTYLQRLSPFAQLVTFDAPSLSRSCTRRERSNTPLQALNLLNDDVAMDAAAALAARVAEELPQGDDSQRVDRLFRLACGRVPGAEEQNRLREFLDAQRALLRDDPQSVERLVPATSVSDSGVTSVNQAGDKDKADKDKAKDKAKATGESDVLRAGVMRLSGRTEQSRVDRAAWMLLASVVLNLHEFVTRP